MANKSKNHSTAAKKAVPAKKVTPKKAEKKVFAKKSPQDEINELKKLNSLKQETIDRLNQNVKSAEDYIQKISVENAELKIALRKVNKNYEKINEIALINAEKRNKLIDVVHEVICGHTLPMKEVTLEGKPMQFPQSSINEDWESIVKKISDIKERNSG